MYLFTWLCYKWILKHCNYIYFLITTGGRSIINDICLFIQLCDCCLYIFISQCIQVESHTYIVIGHKWMSSHWLCFSKVFLDIADYGFITWPVTNYWKFHSSSIFTLLFIYRYLLQMTFNGYSLFAYCIFAYLSIYFHH